ncbi:MAG: helix-turn-helix transcriptional regulator [Azoarcus sp.]|jgi:transcriptional regulator with XRE-family HTH domain|nr:helix-turn-helix transcriptional regulator [Azoarcus sp.]
MNSIWSPSYTLLRTRLRELRERAGITQVQLAAQLGKPQSYVSKVESGERKLDFLEVRDYCVMCGQAFTTFVEMLEPLLEDPSARQSKKRNPPKA